MNQEFQEFFIGLARRFRKENHLSDFTYVAIQTIPEFKKDFVRFFFKDLKIDDEIEVVREFTLDSDDGRPDFVFRCNSWDLIVENKIWDRNYHFEQYGKKPLSSGKFLPLVGLIANHKVTPPPNVNGWETRTWKGFERAFANKKYRPFEDVFGAYLQYVKKVCAMTEFDNFKFDRDSLFALTNFVRMIENTLRTISSSTYEIIVGKTAIGESWAGYSFELKSREPNTRVDLNLFFGIEFSKEAGAPTITIDAHKHCNSNHFLKVKQMTALPKVFERKYRQADNIVSLRMPTEEFNTINDEPNKEKQLESITVYLNACCDALLNCIRA